MVEPRLLSEILGGFSVEGVALAPVRCGISTLTVFNCVNSAFSNKWLVLTKDMYVR